MKPVNKIETFSSSQYFEEKPDGTRSEILFDRSIFGAKKRLVIWEQVPDSPQFYRVKDCTDLKANFRERLFQSYPVTILRLLTGRLQDDLAEVNKRRT